MVGNFDQFSEKWSLLSNEIRSVINKTYNSHKIKWCCCQEINS